MSLIEIGILEIPQHTLVYFINGDASGMSDEEIVACDKFSKYYPGLILSPVDDDPYFSPAPVFGLPCTVVDCSAVYDPMVNCTTVRSYRAASTKFYGPTNHRGARIRVDVAGTKYWYSYNYAAGHDTVHLAPLQESISKWVHDLGRHSVIDTITYSETDQGISAVFTWTVLG